VTNKSFNDDFLRKAGGTRLVKYRYALTLITEKVITYDVIPFCFLKPPADGYEFHDWKVSGPEVVILWKQAIE
jgi:hypothetical protein